MLQVWRGEVCLVICDLVASFKAEKRKVNVGDAWFRVSPLSLSQSWSFESVDVVGLLLIRPLFQEICLLYHFSFLIRSNSVFFVFLLQRSWIDKKITFNYCYFLTNFIYILLCADPMRRNPFLHFEESLSTNNIRWMLSWALVTIIILCVW